MGLRMKVMRMSGFLSSIGTHRTVAAVIAITAMAPALVSSQDPPRIRIYLNWFPVTCLCMSKDMRYIAAVREDNLAIWDVARQKKLFERDVPFNGDLSSYITSIDFSGADPVLSDFSGRILSFSLASREFTALRAFPANPEFHTSQLFGAGSAFAYLDPKGVLSLCPVTDGAANKLGAVGSRKCGGVAVSPDGSTLAVDEEDGVHVIDVAGDREIAQIPDCGIEGGLFDCPVFSENGDEMIARTNDDRLLLWRKRIGIVIQTLAIPDHSFLIAISPDGKYIAVSGQPYAEIWEVGKDGSVRRPAYRLGRVSRTRYLRGFYSCLAFSPDSRTLLMGYRISGGVKVWKFAKGKSFDLGS